MRYKITNFYNNIKLKLFLLKVLLFFVISSSLYSNSTYKMSIENIEVTSNKGIQASVYIENVGDNVIITSYQCALSINQSIDLSSLSLSYIEGSSELLNEPNLFVGVDNIDGPTELTFVSYIGNDIISSKTLVGKFLLQGNIDISSINLLDIQWDFEGTISTIITGKGFENITEPANHKSLFSSSEEELPIAKVNILNSFASEVYGDVFTDQMLYDGISSTTKNSSSSEGRWAAEGFPQWITIDLGEETTVDHIALDPFGSETGISYSCEFYTGTYENKSLISSEITQTGEQWSVHNFGRIKTRYITMVVTGSEGNDWCDFWELEVFGNNTTGIEEDEELAEKSIMPSEYGMSQNYPNPFNPSTKVEVMMKESGSARLDVYNLLGERVLAVMNDELSAGIHEININGSSLASGIYIYKLDIEGRYSKIKKMNLIK